MGVTKEWNTYEELQDSIELNIVTPRVLNDKIKDNLNYNIAYAEERVKQIKDNWDEEVYIDCVSSSQFKRQQVKKTTDSLSDTGDTYTNHLDKIANYILFSAYDNEKDRVSTETLKEEYKQIKKLEDIDRREKKRLENLDKRRTRPSLITNSRPTRAKNVFTMYLDSPRDNPFGLEIDDDGYTVVRYTHNDKQLNQKQRFKNNPKYWVHFGQHNQKTEGLPSIFSKVDYTTTYGQNAYEMIKTKGEAVESLEKQLEKNTYSASQRIKLERLKRENVEEYNITTDTLRSPMEFKMSAPSKPVDPMIQFEQDIDYTDKKIVKELVYNYAALKERYKKKPDSLYSDIIKDIAFATKSVKLSETQRLVVEHVMRSSDWTYQDVMDEFTLNFNREVGKTNINYHLDNFINKLLKFFLEKEL